VLATVLGAVLLIAVDESSASVSSPQAACAISRQEFRHKGELPVAIVRMIEQIATMADANEPFQLTDVIIGKKLPFYRFQSASQIGCRLHAHYEHGGRGHGYGSITFIQSSDSWVVENANFPFCRLNGCVSRP
jgi:hypothetical protein